MSTRQHMVDIDGRKRVVIEHNTVARTVTITIIGPSGGNYGSITLEDNCAADSFRAIIGSAGGAA